MRRWALALASMSLAAPCVAAENAVEIHAVVPLSGGAGFVGQNAQIALQNQEKRVNAEGGIAGRPVHFIVHDDESNPQVAVQLATQVLSAGNQFMLGSSITAMCNAISPLFIKEGAVLYCFSPGIHPAAGTTIYSSSVSTEGLIETLLRYLHQRGLNRLAFITSTDSSGQDGDKGIAKALTLPDLKEIVAVEQAHFNPTDVSVAAQLERIRAAQPQALVTWCSGLQWGTVLKALAQSGVEIPVFATAANLSYVFMAQYATILPKQLYFVGGAGSARGEIPKLDARVVAAKKRYYELFAERGQVPDNGAETAWDPTSIVVDTLRKVGPQATGAAIQASIAHLKNYAGVTGVYDFETEPQRGLTADNGVVSRWNSVQKMFEAVSDPGGEPITR